MPIARFVFYILFSVVLLPTLGQDLPSRKELGILRIHRGGFLWPGHQLDACVAGLVAPQVIAVPESFTAVSAHKGSFGFFFLNPNGIL